MSTMRTLAAVAGVAILAFSTAAANPQNKGKQAGAWKKGQGWDHFAAVFDANKDGKVTKDELMAKRPGFDHLDTNHDGFVSEAEIDALPAAQKNPNLKGWVAKFDQDKDNKVSVAEWDAKRAKAFETADKNHDGAIEASEVTGELMSGGGA
jgi:hypothetical protein